MHATFKSDYGTFSLNPHHQKDIRRDAFIRCRRSPNHGATTKQFTERSRHCSASSGSYEEVVKCVLRYPLYNPAAHLCLEIGMYNFLYGGTWLSTLFEMNLPFPQGKAKILFKTTTERFHFVSRRGRNMKMQNFCSRQPLLQKCWNFYF